MTHSWSYNTSSSARTAANHTCPTVGQAVPPLLLRIVSRNKMELDFLLFQNGLSSSMESLKRREEKLKAEVEALTETNQQLERSLLILKKENR
jgi:hypothetical protein